MSTYDGNRKVIIDKSIRFSPLKEQGIFGKRLPSIGLRLKRKNLCKIATLTLQQACWVTLHLTGLQIKSNGI